VNILLDQNISFRVGSLLSSAFENVKQVKQIGLTDASDLEIWNYAIKYKFSIITFDSGFIDLANLKGYPPKIIWLRFGNASNLKIANKLLSKAEEIKEFIENPDIAFLEIE
jgi:predicted nuclease of predicted toxin-antitoxin system